LTTRRDGAPLIKVLDFGISKVSPASGAAGPVSDASITAPDAILGSPLYMSPEQLQSTKRVDARTDIWSLGVVLHELLTGRPPFEADSVLAIGAMVAAGAPAELRDRCPDAPEGLAAVVRRCLEKDPARRFGSVAELAQALAPYAPERSRLSIERITRVSGATSDGALAHTADAVSPPRRRATLIFVVAVLGLAALFAAWRAPRGSESAPPPAPAVSQSPAPPANTPAAPVNPAPAPAPIAEPPPAALAPKPASPAPSATPPATPRPRRAAASAGGGTTSADSSSRGPARPRPIDPLDPMNPALLSR
jgi:serine/threonine-protein kinase